MEKGNFEDAYYELLIDQICNNSTAEVEIKDGKTIYGGSRSECAMLQFAHQIGTNYHDKRDSARIVKMLPFSSAIKQMGACMKYDDDNNVVYVKGGAERVLPNCTKYIDLQGETHGIDNEFREEAQQAIDGYADQALRTLTIAYKLVDKDYALVDDNYDPDI